MTTALEAIKARAEKATEGPWFRQYGDVITAEPDPRDIHSDAPRDCRISRRAEHLDYKDPQGIKDAEFIAYSRTDVPKLVAALEAVQARLSEQASQFRETADRLIQHVLDHDPDRDVEGASRYSHYAASWDAAQRMTERTIAEALQ